MRRVHVLDPLKWGVAPGTDFWLKGGANGQGTASGNNLLTDGGWTLTSMAHVAGSAADFASKTDPGTPGHFQTNAAADLIQSPAIFGDYHHMRMAAELMGWHVLPRYLIADAYAQFSTLSADEVTTNLGFVEDGGSIVTAADILLSVYSKGTGATFNVQSNAAVVTGLVTVSTTWNAFRFILDRQLGIGYVRVNGVLTGQIAITTDEFPVAFGAGNDTTNRIQLAGAHIFYDQRVPRDPQEID